MARTVSTAPADSAEGVNFGLLNWALVAAGLVAIIIGYVALSHGSIILAPLLLVLGYVFLVPLGIIL